MDLKIFFVINQTQAQNPPKKKKDQDRNIPFFSSSNSPLPIINVGTAQVDVFLVKHQKIQTTKEMIGHNNVS